MRSKGQHTLPNGIVSNNRYYKVSSNIIDRPVGQFNSIRTNTAVTEQAGYPQITEIFLQNPRLANPAHSDSIPIFQGNGQPIIVQQTQWDKGSIFRDTPTGGTTFSNLYQINHSGVSSFQNWKLEVSTPMAS